VPFVASVFSQLLEPLDRRVLNRIVARHEGDRGVGSGPNAWTCVRHLRTLLFAQFAGLNSLREIEQGLAAHPGGLYHLDLRLPRRSTLSDAQAQRPAAVFRDICQLLIGQVSRAVRQQGQQLIELIDGSPILLRDPRYAWAQSDPHTRGLKLHVGYDPRSDTVNWVEIASPRVSELTLARARPIAPGTIYVYDKGYADFGWWHAIDAAGATFVTRLKINTKRRDVRARPIQPCPGQDEAILEDNDVKIGHARPRGGSRNLLFNTPLREILVAREGKPPMRLITNDLARPASEIAALYKERWQIELLFKWIKQNLKIKRFLGRSENAVKIQIYVALIAYLLLRMLRHTCAASHRHAPKALITRIKVALFNRLDLSGRAKPPPTQPAKLTQTPQLLLNL
jgi:putative transposase